MFVLRVSLYKRRKALNQANGGIALPPMIRELLWGLLFLSLFSTSLCSPFPLPPTVSPTQRPPPSSTSIYHPPPPPPIPPIHIIVSSFYLCASSSSWSSSCMLLLANPPLSFCSVFLHIVFLLIYVSYSHISSCFCPLYLLPIFRFMSLSLVLFIQWWRHTRRARANAMAEMPPPWLPPWQSKIGKNTITYQDILTALAEATCLCPVMSSATVFIPR